MKERNELVSNTPENLEQVINEELNLFTRKNSDYGNSFEKALDEDGLLVAKIRLGDKFNRFVTLLKKSGVTEVKDESMRDTLMDLATYAHMTILWMDKLKENGTD